MRHIIKFTSPDNATILEFVTMDFFILPRIGEEILNAGDMWTIKEIRHAIMSRSPSPAHVIELCCVRQ